VLTHAAAEALKPHDVTSTPYDALRILRGAGDGGLCRHEIRDRLVALVPDVTRLLDRLEDAGLVARQRSSADRRLVMVHGAQKLFVFGIDGGIDAFMQLDVRASAIPRSATASPPGAGARRTTPCRHCRRRRRALLVEVGVSLLPPAPPSQLPRPPEVPRWA
jgi:hypothetical protein